MQKNSACMQAKESRTRAIPQKEVWLRFFCVTQLIKEKHLFCCLVHNKYKTKQYLRNRLPQKNLTARENSSVLCTLSIKISWQTSLWPHQIESSFGTCANAFFQRPMVQNACHRMIPRREPFRHHGGTRWCHRALTLPRCRRSLKCIFSSPDDSGPIFSLANGSVDVPKRLQIQLSQLPPRTYHRQGFPNCLITTWAFGCIIIQGGSFWMTTILNDTHISILFWYRSQCTDIFWLSRNWYI